MLYVRLVSSDDSKLFFFFLLELRFLKVFLKSGLKKFVWQMFCWDVLSALHPKYLNFTTFFFPRNFVVSYVSRNMKCY